MSYRVLVTLLLLAFFDRGVASAQSSMTVKSEMGTIIGTRQTVETVKGETVEVDVFLGIPYAKPPVGDLRFQKPQRANKFSTPFKALHYGASCPQTRMYPMLLPEVMSEDCLFLNVFVPAQPTNKSNGRAVMVWIHGGGLVKGNSDLYGGAPFVAVGDVILVTINYRLGMLGFFSTGDEHAPGNMGFWDQRLALQWVQENIKAFGGDPDRVTIFGESAGGVSVALQAIHPGNKGLFHRAISQSGTATSMHVAKQEEAKESSVAIGKLLKCPIETSEELIACLRKKDYNELISETQKDYDPLLPRTLKLLTTIDGEFVKSHPKYLMAQARAGEAVKAVEFYRSLDSLSGCNNREGVLRVSNDLENYAPSRDEAFRGWELKLPSLGHSLIGDWYHDLFNTMIKSEYTDWNQPDNPFNVRDEIVQLIGDMIFDIPTVEFARLHANDTNDVNSYVYYFTEKPSWNFLPTASWVDGANHGDELPLLFGFNEGWCTFVNRSTKPEDWERHLSARMITYWTNFAKTGNPNMPTPVSLEWPKYKTETQKYMEFRKEVDKIGEYFKAKRANFWLNTIPAVRDAIQNMDAALLQAADDTCSADGTCGNT